MKLVLIPAGTFLMGSLKAEDGAEDERPQHKVTLEQAYYMGVYPVTQEEYKKVMLTNPSYFSPTGEGKAWVMGMSTSNFPVEQVSWVDAKAFCAKLSDLAAEKTAGRLYRVPSEAEWEYACRAGSTKKYHYGDTEDDLKAVGWYEANSGSRPHNVGRKKPNAWGLHDMHGNVAQWCNDWYFKDYYSEGFNTNPKGPISGASRVVRGGNWLHVAGNCRAAIRGSKAPAFRYNNIGFRVVCDVQRAR
jgi:formylglycine-generating enzyme required for sulfatase activity